MLSHADDADPQGRIFSRASTEYWIRTPKGHDLVLLVNHFKSQGYGAQAESDARRARQARRVAQIYRSLRAQGAQHIAVVGDLNDAPTSPPLESLLMRTDLRDASEHPTFDDGGRPGTFGAGNASEKFDHLLLSVAKWDALVRMPGNSARFPVPAEAMRFSFAVAFTATSLAGCAAQPIEAQIADLKVQHERERVRLDEIRRTILEAEMEATHAHARAAFEECRSVVAAIRGDVAIRQATCAEDAAKYNGCMAAYERSKGKSGIAGCLIGIGAAFLTGGAAMPFSLGGCALGLAAPGDAMCDVPACVRDVDSLRSLVLAARNQSEMPSCGGYLGLELADYTTTAKAGLRVSVIGPATTAHLLGLRVGDVIIEIDGQPIDLRTVHAVVTRVSPSATITLSVVRDGVYRKLVGTAQAIDAYGLPAPETRLGVEHSPAADIPYKNGVQVGALSKASPGETAGARVGDIVESIEAQPIAHLDDATDALNAIPPGNQVRFGLRRGDAQLVITVTSLEVKAPGS